MGDEGAADAIARLLRAVGAAVDTEDRVRQRSVVQAALDLLTTATRPGTLTTFE